jgi:hypothetical protein
MLDILSEVELELSELLKDESLWGSLYIDYDHPNVERVYRNWNGYRINLHLIHEVPDDKRPLYHPHPWPAAMRILDGEYQMELGSGDYSGPEPRVVSRLIMSEGSAYEMINMDAWHTVRPLDGKVASLMVTGKPWWDGWSPNDKEISMGPLNKNTKLEILELFKSFY